MNYSDKTTLVSLNDSLLQNLNKHSFKKEDIIVNKVQKIINKNNLLTIDCGSLFLNKQHNITEFLKNNLSIKEIKSTQIESIYLSRRSFFKYFISTELTKYYNFEENDQNIHISDSIKESKNVGILLSCVANDLMNLLGIDPITYVLTKINIFNKSNKIKILNMLLDDVEIRKKTIEGLKNNIEEILGINPNSKICVFGIYKPKMLPNKFKEIIEDINIKVKDLAISYNQSYIDINKIKSKLFDFHPNKKGYDYISNTVAEELIKRFNNDSHNKKHMFKYKNLGLDGAISDLNLYAEEDNKYINNLLNHLSVKHNYNKKEITKLFENYIIDRKNEIVETRRLYLKSKKY